MKEADDKLTLDSSVTYEIKVPGRLDESWSEWAGGMAITVEGGDDRATITTLTGVVADQAALQGLLSRLYSLGLPLISVKCIESGDEEAGAGVNSRTVKEGVRELAQYISFKLPATGWYYSKEKPWGSIGFDDGTWVCMFKFVERVAMGEKLCFSPQNTGCRYAAFYLGFDKPGIDEGAFLGTQARTKKNAELGIEYYRAIQAPSPQEEYLVLERIEDIEDDVAIDVVNLWIDALSLTGLVALANFDSKMNDSVVVPYAAGCQGIWTIPYKETFQKSPKAVVGSMDPVVRKYLPSDILSFSMPAKRFVEMSKNVSDSFLKLEPWATLVTGE